MEDSVRRFVQKQGKEGVNELRDAIIELYLAIKIRSTEELD